MWDTHPARKNDALARHEAILRDAVKACGGHIFSTGGDGMAVAFARSAAAVYAAVDAQRSLLTV